MEDAAHNAMLEEKGDLKRELGLFSAVNLILGVMIGSGIFVSPAAALAYSGSVGLCLVIWTLSGIIALLGKEGSYCILRNQFLFHLLYFNRLILKGLLIIFFRSIIIRRIRYSSCKVWSGIFIF